MKQDMNDETNFAAPENARRVGNNAVSPTAGTPEQTGISSAPPHEMTTEEAIAVICDMVLHTPDTTPAQLRAAVIAAKALARAGIHRRRVHASRNARGPKR